MEIWKDIEGYSNYQVSNLGRVKNLKTGRILKGTGLEYRKVALYSNKQVKTISIHRLVAQAFVPNPNNYNYVNHKDENKYNNNADNLEWCTNEYNCNYGSCYEIKSKAHSKNKVKQLNTNGEIIKIWNSVYELCKSEGYNKLTIWKSCREHLKNYGYYWEYVI